MKRLNRCSVSWRALLFALFVFHLASVLVLAAPTPSPMRGLERNVESSSSSNLLPNTVNNEVDFPDVPLPEHAKPILERGSKLYDTIMEQWKTVFAQASLLSSHKLWPSQQPAQTAHVRNALTGQMLITITTQYHEAADVVSKSVNQLQELTKKARKLARSKRGRNELETDELKQLQHGANIWDSLVKVLSKATPHETYTSHPDSFSLGNEAERLAARKWLLSKHYEVKELAEDVDKEQVAPAHDDYGHGPGNIPPMNHIPDPQQDDGFYLQPPQYHQEDPNLWMP